MLCAKHVNVRNPLLNFTSSSGV